MNFHTILSAFAWILIPAALMSAALVLIGLLKWQRLADRSIKHITR